MNLEALKAANKIVQASSHGNRYAKYRSDPVAFARDVLNNTFTDDVKQVISSVRDNPITIAKSANGIGKSHSAARIAVWFYTCFNDGDCQVYLTAAPPIDNLERILWGEIMSIVDKHPELFPYDKIRAKMIMRSPQSFIKCVAIPMSGTREERIAKFSGKHAAHQLFIVDEGDAVPEEVYTGIEGCMSGEHSRLLIMFNPRAQVGPVYLKEENKQANIVHLSAMNHPNVLTGQEIIPGAVTRGTTVRRINEWTQELAPDDKVGIDCFQVPSFLVGTSATSFRGDQYQPLPAGWRRIREPSFSYMVLGEYPAQSEMQLINSAWIEAARQRYDNYVKLHGLRPPEIRPIIGVDIAEFGTDANVACLRYGDFIAPLIAWNGVDPDYSATRALDIARTHNAQQVFVDGNGPGAGVAPSMARNSYNEDIRCYGLRVSERPSTTFKTELGEFQALRDQLWWIIREWLRTSDKAMLPDDRNLIEELKTPSYKIKEENGKIKVMGKDMMREYLKRSPDRADALCLAFAPIQRARVVRLSDAYTSNK